MPFFSASGISPYNKTSESASSGPSTDPNADAWFAAASPPISDPTEMAAVNQFALDLKGTGSTPNNSDVWNSLHWINLVSATSLAASLNDLKGGYNLTAYNSPTWSQNGIMGNGINQYLQQDYIADSDGSVLNSNSFGIAVRTPQSVDASLMGARYQTAPYNVFNYYSGLRYIGNNSTFTSFNDSNYPSGVIISNRVNSTDFETYFDNTLTHSTAITTNTLAIVPMNIFSQNYQGSALAFSDMEFTVAFEGEGLTANQMEDLNASINTLNANIIAGGRATPVAFTGILDTYTNAKVAFSLRRLSGSYTGPLITVRRDSDNTSQDIGYDSNNVLDTVALLAFVGAGDGFVSVWYDQSGNGSDATQATASSQFKIVNAGVVNLSGGKPSLLVGENNAQLISTASITESSERSQFCVLEKIGPHYGASSAIYLQYGFPYLQMYVPVNEFTYYNGANIPLTGANFTSGIPQLINTNQGTSSGNAYLDGQNIPVSIGGATGNITAAPIILGGFLTNGMNGNMSEYINWAGDKSSDRAGIENNINAFYTIY